MVNDYADTRFFANTFEKTKSFMKPFFAYKSVDILWHCPIKAKRKNVKKLTWRRQRVKNI